MRTPYKSECMWFLTTGVIRCDWLAIQLTHYCLTGPYVPRIVKISFFKKVGIIQKISHERRDYESVDGKSLS